MEKKTLLINAISMRLVLKLYQCTSKYRVDTEYFCFTDLTRTTDNIHPRKRAILITVPKRCPRCKLFNGKKFWICHAAFRVPKTTGKQAYKLNVFFPPNELKRDLFRSACLRTTLVQKHNIAHELRERHWLGKSPRSKISNVSKNFTTTVDTNKGVSPDKKHFANTSVVYKITFIPGRATHSSRVYVQSRVFADSSGVV